MTFRSRPKYWSYDRASDPSNSSYLNTYQSTYKYIVKVNVKTEVNAIMKSCCSLPYPAVFNRQYGLEFEHRETGRLVQSATGGDTFT